MKRANTMSTITVELIIKMKTKFTSSNAEKTNGFISPQMSDISSQMSYFHMWKKPWRHISLCHPSLTENQALAEVSTVTESKVDLELDALMQLVEKVQHSHQSMEFFSLGLCRQRTLDKTPLQADNQLPVTASLATASVPVQASHVPPA